MSFLKIIDPKKRDFIANEFLNTRQNIQQIFLSELVGDLNTQYELSKLFKPVTDMQKELKEGLVSEIKPIIIIIIIIIIITDIYIARRKKCQS